MGSFDATVSVVPRDLLDGFSDPVRAIVTSESRKGHCAMEGHLEHSGHERLKFSSTVSL
jgi:hypothetical protein